MLTTANHSQRRIWLALLIALASGCASTKAVPVHRLPAEFLAIPRADKEPINFIRLRQDPPSVYQLGPRDVLGIYIEGILGQSDQPPPVHFPERDGSIPPAIGFPIPIREDGTIALPLLPNPLRVSGLTLTQAEQDIRNEYVKLRLLPEGRDRTIVTLIRKRTYQVLVIREDSAAGGGGGGELVGAGLIQRGSARAVDLRAYENDVLHALAETGGMPGLDAKNQVIILRGAMLDAQGRASILRVLEDGEPIENVISPDNPNMLIIPLRRRPSDPPIKIDEEDIILSNGDIVYIQNREREVFYTGGLLQGREQLLPRDYDLDILGALAVTGGSVAGAPGSGGTGSNSAMGGSGSFSNPRGLIPPTDCVVIRKVKGGYQIPIRVNIRRAISSPGERILIQPGDLVILQYTPMEMIANIMLNNIQLNYFLNNFGGN